MRLNFFKKKNGGYGNRANNNVYGPIELQKIPEAKWGQPYTCARFVVVNFCLGPWAGSGALFRLAYLLT